MRPEGTSQRISERFLPRSGSQVFSWLPSVLVVLPLVGLALYWDERRMVFLRPLHGGANPVAATRGILRGIEPYLFDHGNFRPIGRLWEWLVFAFVYDASETTAVPPHLVLGAIRLIMVVSVAVAAGALVRALMRSADVPTKSLTWLYPLILAASLVTTRGGGGLGAFPHVFAGSVALMLTIALAVCRDRDLRRRPLQRREYVLMAASGVAAASFYDLMYLTPALAAAFLVGRAIAAHSTPRDVLGTAAVRRWLIHAGAFMVVAVPTRIVIAVNCADGGCYEGSALSLSGAAIGATLGRFWSGLAPFSWTEASERAQRAGADLGLHDMWSNSLVVLAVVTIAALVVRSSRTGTLPEGPAFRGSRHYRLAAALLLIGITTAAGAALIAGLSEAIQLRQPAIGVAWRETLLVQVGLSFVLTSCLAALQRVRLGDRGRSGLHSIVAGTLGVAMTMTLLANWQHAETRRRSEADALTSMIAASAVLPADEVGANSARCHLIEALIKAAPSGWAGGEMVGADLEALWLTRYGFPFCEPPPK